MSATLTPETQAIVDKVEKLLRLAASNPNEAEAASATAKAQELLTAYNLDMGAVEANSGDTGKRAEEKMVGGQYEWEQRLWRSVAHLNFCMYWNQVVFVPTKMGLEIRYIDGKRTLGILDYQHRLVGRTVNIASTKVMARYLQEVAERLTRDRLKENGERIRGRWAMAFRDGVTTRIADKIFHMRAELMEAEAAKAQEAEIRQREAEAAGISLSTAVTITAFTKSEADANLDFVYGEGYSAKVAAERARKAAAKREADEALTKWAAENPKEAARQERARKREKEREDRRNARSRGSYKGDSGAFFAGYDAAKDISIHRQADDKRAKGLLK